MPVAEERGITKAQAKVCPCESCKAGRKEPSKIEALMVHSYSSQPRGGWVKQMTRDEVYGTAPTVFMGVELETSVKAGARPNYEIEELQRTAIRTELRTRLPQPRWSGIQREYTAEGGYTEDYQAFRRAERTWRDDYYRLEQELWDQGFGKPRVRNDESFFISGEEAVSLAEPVGFWHPKHDSSVSGPEFAGLPASLDYWYSIRPDLERMFTGLLHGGMRSHTGDTCGMHISMSIESFDDSDHLIRFAKLVNTNIRWSKRMSQRTEHSLHWSQIGHDQFMSGNEHRLERWAKSVMMYGEDSSGDRYNAINTQCGGGRIEFRLPRGTLRLDRFYKNLEWVASMIEFTRSYSATDSATYMRWVMGTERFADLKAFLIEKFHLIDTRDGFTPAPALVSENATKNTNDPNSNQMCPCGDGCRRDDCGNCREAQNEYDNDPEDFYEDEDESVECVCGMTHDLARDSYVSWTYGSEMHYHANGDWIIYEPDTLAQQALAQLHAIEVQPVPAAVPAVMPDRLIIGTADWWSAVAEYTPVPPPVTPEPVTTPEPIPAGVASNVISEWNEEQQRYTYRFAQEWLDRLTIRIPSGND